MDFEGIKFPILQDNTGFYLTFKLLKNLKFADTVTILEVQTALKPNFKIPKEIHDNPESWHALSNLYISTTHANLKKNLQKFSIGYLRHDGKPERITLFDAYKVRSFVLTF